MRSARSVLTSFFELAARHPVLGVLCCFVLVGSAYHRGAAKSGDAGALPDAQVVVRDAARALPEASGCPKPSSGVVTEREVFAFSGYVASVSSGALHQGGVVQAVRTRKERGAYVFVELWPSGRATWAALEVRSGKKPLASGVIHTCWNWLARSNPVDARAPAHRLQLKLGPQAIDFVRTSTQLSRLEKGLDTQIFDRTATQTPPPSVCAPPAHIPTALAGAGGATFVSPSAKELDALSLVNDGTVTWYHASSSGKRIEAGITSCCFRTGPAGAAALTFRGCDSLRSGVLLEAGLAIARANGVSAIYVKAD